MEAQLLIYDDLPTDERQRADAYLELHPEAWEIVERGRRLQRVFREAVRQDAAEEPEISPEDADRVDEVVSQLPPAREHLAALMSEAHERRNRPKHADRAPTRPAVRLHRRASRAWLVAVAVAVVVVGLVVASATSVSTHERVAALPTLPHSVPGLTLRSGDTDVDQVSESYLSALTIIHEARSTTLGLFPNYDAGELESAIEQLSETARMDPGGTIGLEAVYVRGRLHLYLGEVEDAIRDLNLVVEQSGPSASDARRVLAEIEARL